VEAVEKPDESRSDAGQAGKDAYGERTVEEAQRIEDPHDVQREHGAHQDRKSVV
jgi:hypothetical protein